MGVLIAMFSGKEKVKKAADIVIGFGILFLGLSTMSSSMAEMKNVPAVVNLLGSLKNPFMATLVGLVLTSVIQSSSVTVSIGPASGKSGFAVPAYYPVYYSGL